MTNPLHSLDKLSKDLDEKLTVSSKSGKLGHYKVTTNPNSIGKQKIKPCTLKLATSEEKRDSLFSKSLLSLLPQEDTVSRTQNSSLESAQKTFQRRPVVILELNSSAIRKVRASLNFNNPEAQNDNNHFSPFRNHPSLLNRSTSVQTTNSTEEATQKFDADMSEENNIP